MVEKQKIEIKKKPKRSRKQGYNKKRKEQIEIATERIKKLFSEAAIVFKKDSKEGPKLANRYVHLARKMAMKFKIKFTSAQRRRFCKHCYSYLVYSVNSRVRLKDKKLVYYCKNCKKYTRIPYKNKLKK